MTVLDSPNTNTGRVYSQILRRIYSPRVSETSVLQPLQQRIVFEADTAKSGIRMQSRQPAYHFTKVVQMAFRFIVGYPLELRPQFAGGYPMQVQHCPTGLALSEHEGKPRFLRVASCQNDMQMGCKPKSTFSTTLFAHANVTSLIFSAVTVNELNPLQPTSS
jgi:hypothetical protein